MTRISRLWRSLRERLGKARRPTRARVPTILQMEAVECGAASLAMMLAFFGRFVPLEELRVACGVSRDGSRAQNILKAGRAYGLTGKAFRKEVPQLRKLTPPFIVHWNFNHFLVIEGFRGGRVFLNDPATGPRSVTVAELDNSFTGVVLTFERGDAFQKGGYRRTQWQALWPRIAGSLGPLALLFVVGCLLLTLTIVMPSLQAIFIDDVLIKGLHEWTGPLVLALLATAMGLSVLTAVYSRYVNRLKIRMTLSGSTKVAWHLLSLPVGFFTQRNAGELATRVGLNERVAHLLSSELSSALMGVFGIALFATFMLEYDRVLASLILVTTAMNVGSVRLAATARVNTSRRLSQDQGKMMGTAMGGLKTIESLKAMGAESDFFSRWAGYQAKVLSRQQTVKLQSELLAVIPIVLIALNAILILGIGGHRVMDGSMTIGMLVAFQSLASLIASPVQNVVSFASDLPEADAKVERIDDVLQAQRDPCVRPPTIEEIEGGSEKLTGLVTLTNVTFGYSPLEPPLIEDFNLTLKPGTRVALVGGSGSGKSTVVSLVCGLYEPWRGEIAFDGIPRSQLSHYRLGQSFAVVDQDVFLFEGTIRENLTLWDQTVPDADLVHAASDACVHDEIMSRAGGYSSRVDEGGRNFSGGQAQRLEIARALVCNPTVIVLDEATSALDPVTERVFDENLRRRGCTCLIVAHRLSTIRDCDEIVVMERGRIVQRGTHDQMKSMPGPYAALIASEAA
jgi:NHLM bacteriocin system ABC transporter peptidase/ATP-binding protein